MARQRNSFKKMCAVLAGRDFALPPFQSNVKGLAKEHFPLSSS